MNTLVIPNKLYRTLTHTYAAKATDRLPFQVANQALIRNNGVSVDFCDDRLRPRERSSPRE